MPSVGVVATADLLQQFDTVYLGFVLPQLPGSVATAGTGALLINGDVNLKINNRLSIAASSYIDQTATGANVTLSANYVQLAGTPKGYNSTTIQAANTPNNDKTASQVNGILFFTKTSSICRQSGQIRKLKGSRRLKDCLVSVGAQLWFC